MSHYKRIILIGPPGCGKGTIASKIEERFKIKHVSTGSLLRNELEAAKALPESERTSLQDQILTTVNSGNFIDDATMVTMLSSRLKDSFVLDGFPRTMEQIHLLNVSPDIIIFIDVDKDICVERLIARNEDREDDSLDIAKHRMDVYCKYTFPVVEYLKETQNFVKINGNKTKEEVKEIVFDLLLIK